MGKKKNQKSYRSGAMVKNLNLMRVIEKGFYDVYVRYERTKSQSSHKSKIAVACCFAWRVLYSKLGRGVVTPLLWPNNIMLIRHGTRTGQSRPYYR